MDYFKPNPQNTYICSNTYMSLQQIKTLKRMEIPLHTNQINNFFISANTQCLLQFFHPMSNFVTADLFESGSKQCPKDFTSSQTFLQA